MELARALYSMFEMAKRSGDIDAPLKLLRWTVDATTRNLCDVPIACRKGCSHCCNIWVSAAPPEVLSIARIIRLRGQQVIDRVRTAYEHTKDYAFEIREEHPHPCPLLEHNFCSIYESRPDACRLAASLDAAVCARSYLNVVNEGIPTPVVYLISRGIYTLVLNSALKKASLPYHAYEFNSALVRALDTPNAEQAWLAGNDIFAGLKTDGAGDTFADESAQAFYRKSFGAD